MLYGVIESRRFLRSLKRVSHYREFDRTEFEELLAFLRTDEPVPMRYRDHQLKGEHVGIRECHLRGDLVLLYKKEKEVLVLLLVNIGTHASVFGE